MTGIGAHHIQGPPQQMHTVATSIRKNSLRALDAIHTEADTAMLLS
jgi:hypothetical protein